jgi:hypothetical protein
MLNIKSLLQDSGKGIRTQITLTPLLKRAIEAKNRLTGESLSSYLRQAAVLRIAAEEQEKEELEVLADAVVGSVKRQSHPEWQTKKKINSWLKKIRQEWP